MKPVVDGLATKFAGRYDIKVLNLSGGDAAATRLAGSYGVSAVPTFVFLNRDGSLSSKIVGGMSAQDFEAELAKLK